ncbi:unnamed protein product [Heterobilharzia americana]|nr:unnamed protein product [Heterobilharzia americana]
MLKRIEVPRSSIGFGFRLRNECPCLIDHVVGGSPAERSGVSVGDRLLKVNGVDVTCMTHEKVASLIWRCQAKLLIEILSLGCDCDPCVSRSLESSSHDLQCATSVQQKRFYTFGPNSSVFIYAGCVSVPVNLKLCAKDLSVVRRKANSVVNKIDASANSICLVCISCDVLCVRLYNGCTAEYPASCLFAAGLVDFDEKFFHIVTRITSKQNETAVKTLGSPTEKKFIRPMNCHVFRTLPSKFLSHSGHTTIAEMFAIHCSIDRLTGECCNFPSSTISILTHLHNLLRKSGVQNVNTGEHFYSCPNSCVQSRQSINVNYIPTDTSAKSLQMRCNSMEADSHNSHDVYQICSFQCHPGSLSTDTSFSPKKSRKSLPEPINANLLSKFIRATTSFSSRIMSPKNSTETIQTDYDERLSKVSCFSSMIEDEDIENMKPHRNADTLSYTSSDPTLWAKDFDNLLNDPFGCNEFKKFLTSEFSSENLDFLLSVRNWRDAFLTRNVHEDANEIFNKFLVPDAPQAVNIDHSAVKSASSCLSNPHMNMFSEAEKQVYLLMKTDSYPRFLESSNYLSILNDFNVNKSTRKSMSLLNRSQIFRSKTKFTKKTSLKVSTVNSQIGNSENLFTTPNLKKKLYTLDCYYIEQ